MTKRTDKLRAVAPAAAQVVKDLDIQPDQTRAGPIECVEVAVGRIDPSPDNPRSARFTESYLSSDPEFLELRASIKANSQGGTKSGNIQPVLLRPHPTAAGRYQLIAGERRWRAADLEEVPAVLALIREGLTERQAFELTVLEGRQQPLTPMEAARAVATLLDRYQEDAKSVAATMGLSESMVLKLAQIERGLVPVWKRAALEEEDYAHWTAAHWVQIARLPAALQEAWHHRIEKDYRFDPHDATADKVGEWLQTEKLFLTKAPFDAAGCQGCDKRTDAIHLLLWAEADQAQAELEEARCLDPKCWERKTCRKVKEEFKTKALGLVGYMQPVMPISLIEAGTKNEYDWEAARKYAGKIKAAKKAFGKSLLEADRITIVKEGTKGAVPGIIVAGKGKGGVKWVKIAEKTKDTGRGGTYKPSAQQLAREAAEQRWGEVVKIICGQIAAQDLARPGLAMILLVRELYHAGSDEFKKIERVGQRPEAEILRWVADRAWRTLQKEAGHKMAYASYYDKDRWAPVAKLLGIDAEAIYADLQAKEKKSPNEATEEPIEKKEIAGPAGPESPVKRKRGRPRKVVATPIEDGLADSTRRDCIGDCENCAQPNCNGRETEFASHGTPPAGPEGGRPQEELPPPGVETIPIDLPKTYEAEVELRIGRLAGVWHGGFAARIGSAQVNLPPDQAEDAFESRRACLDRVRLDLEEWMSVPANKIKNKDQVQIAARVEEAVELYLRTVDSDRTPRRLPIVFPPGCEAQAEILAHRIGGLWFGGFTISVHAQTAEKQVSNEAPSYATKATCLEAMVVSIGQWLDSQKVKICNQGLRIQVFVQVQEAVGQELAKRTCRMCGCTDDNCQQCFERTGKVCTWVEDDLCSACATPEETRP